MKEKILASICYTELVYQRINKKLQTELDKAAIEAFIYQGIEDPTSVLMKQGKNFYITNTRLNLRVTVNSNTFRVITVDRLEK